MNIRKSIPSDLFIIMEIYEKARSFMKDNNNETQWVDGYPSKELILKDIASQKSYVCVDKGAVIAVFYYAVEIDDTYLVIENGNWLNEDVYGVVHRLAVAEHQKGVASFCVKFAFENCRNLRVDTHNNNLPMRNGLIKLGFRECGTIYISSGDARIAFQKI